KQQINIRWSVPQPGWFALNTDGAAKIGEGKAGCGGVLRDEEGRWIEGFTKALGDTNAYIAELWGIFEGLCLAKRKRVTKLELRTDSQVIAQNLQLRTNGSAVGYAFMKKIWSLLDGHWEVKISHACFSGSKQMRRYAC
ncbi:ribonuclease H protein, partial [Trifolium medium]|nr:ribonuclease H protein [Trifolium medium]